MNNFAKRLGWEIVRVEEERHHSQSYKGIFRLSNVTLHASSSRKPLPTRSPSHVLIVPLVTHPYSAMLNQNCFFICLSPFLGDLGRGSGICPEVGCVPSRAGVPRKGQEEKGRA
jgi:hypothetical protein